MTNRKKEAYLVTYSVKNCKLRVEATSEEEAVELLKNRRLAEGSGETEIQTVTYIPDAYEGRMWSI